MHRAYTLLAVALLAVAPLAALTSVASPASATNLEGALSGYLGPGVYRIVGDIYVPSGQTLTLAPGVVFQFEDSFWGEYEFDVYGTLNAQGTAATPIVFQTAPGAAEYNYIRLTTSSSVLRHCTIEHAGSVALLAEGGLWIDNCSPVIDRCVVRNGYWHGIYVTGSGARPQITGTQCLNNDGDGIDGDSGAGLVAVNCVIRGNAGDGICVADGPNTIVGCLITGNGEDGIDSHGLSSYDALIVNCTIAGNASENLSDAAEMDLWNTIVAGSDATAGSVQHSYMVSDVSFYRFVNAAGGDYRLAADSPCLNLGTRFGPPAAWLPPTDLDGSPRIVGIVDLGAFESSYPVDPGEEGEHFSAGLLSPRMTHPVVRTPGEDFDALIGLMGSYGPEEVRGTLLGPLGDAFPLDVRAVSRADLVPGSELEIRLYAPGLETIQQVALTIPPETPPDLYDLSLGVGPYEYRSIHAVQVLESYPSEWRFIHVTDLHIGYDAEEYTAAQRFRAFVREANFLHPSLVVMTGDMCENQNLDTSAYVDSLLAITALLRVPALVLPGNHDYYNDGGVHHPGYPRRYFHRVSRFKNAWLRCGQAHFFAFDSGHDLGLLELWRCRGPESRALDWAAGILAGLDPASQRPRFFLMHGPNYDYFSWNDTNAARVRELMDAHGVSLCLCGHTHRFETFLNSGDNYLGRNDFVHEDDWGRDVPFPGYPLHVQTSSLGKEEHLPMPATLSPEEAAVVRRLEETRGARRRGIFGDDIGWRYVQVNNGEVEFFTADTDGDGHRNTEDPWLLGELSFSIEHQAGGIIVSHVRNDHFETWTDVRHLIPADPGVEYEATGGTIMRRDADGTVEVAVDVLGALATSTVFLTPVSSGVRDQDPRDPSPATAALSLTAVRDPAGGGLRLLARGIGADPHPALHAFDTQGRRVRDLSSALQGGRQGCLQDRAPHGEAVVDWDGRDEFGRTLPPGLYYIRLSSLGRQAVLREVRLR